MNRIKQLRTEKGMRQTELAKILKIGQATMSNWETGRSEPDYDALIEMSEIFGTSIDYILGNSDIKKAPSYEDAGLSTRVFPPKKRNCLNFFVRHRKHCRTLHFGCWRQTSAKNSLYFVQRGLRIYQPTHKTDKLLFFRCHNSPS